MMTNKSDHDIKVRATVKLSDPDIIWGANTSPVWESLFNKPWEKTCGLLVKQAFRFNKGMLSFLHWSVFRSNPGEKTTGLMVILVSVCFLIGYNNANVPTLLKPVAGFAVPFWVYSKSWDELYQLVVVDVESKFLLVYSGLFVLTSLTHLVMIWIGRSNSSLTKRGEGWIGVGLSKLIPVNEFVSNLLDFVVAVSIGVAAWKFAGDVHFGVFMISTASAELAQTILDHSYRSHTRSILNA